MLEGDCVFNRTVVMDLMKIAIRTVLYIVDRDIKFSVAAFSCGESTADVWNIFVMKWVAAYIGFTEVAVLDQGPQFQSAAFASLQTAAGIRYTDGGVE